MLISQKHALCGLCRRAGGCKSVYECACVLVHYWFASLCTFLLSGKRRRWAGSGRAAKERNMFGVCSRTAVRNGSLIPPFPYVVYQTINMGVNYTHRQKSGFSGLFQPPVDQATFSNSESLQCCLAGITACYPCKTLMMLRAPWNLFFFFPHGFPFFSVSGRLILQ